jgi:hypothetical protein
MSQRYLQVQNDATYRSASPRPQAHSAHASRSSSESSASSSSSHGSAHAQARYSLDSLQPRVEVLRCSRCAKCVETISTGTGGARRVSSDEASASGMVRFGHNLYYCDRCARMVGYK